MTEEVISQYSSLKLGLSLKIIGQPRELFGNTKRVLDVEKAIIVQDMGQDEAMVEIRFRNRLNHLRSQVYNQPFRLSNVWPDGLNLLDQTHQVRPPDRSALQEDQLMVPVGFHSGQGTQEIKIAPGIEVEV